MGRNCPPKPAEYFSGTVRVNPLFEARDQARPLDASFTFERGADVHVGEAAPNHAFDPHSSSRKRQVAPQNPSQENRCGAASLESADQGGGYQRVDLPLRRAESRSVPGTPFRARRRLDLCPHCERLCVAAMDCGSAATTGNNKLTDNLRFPAQSQAPAQLMNLRRNIRT